MEELEKFARIMDFGNVGNDGKGGSVDFGNMDNEGRDGNVGLAIKVKVTVLA